MNAPDLLLHWHPKSFLAACEVGIRNNLGDSDSVSAPTVTLSFVGELFPLQQP